MLGFDVTYDFEDFEELGDAQGELSENSTNIKFGQEAEILLMNMKLFQGR